MKKVYKQMIILVVLLVGVSMGIFYLYQHKEKESLILKGKKEITISLHSHYQDEGVNISQAQVKSNVNTKKAGTYQVTYSYHNETLTRIVHVVDHQEVIMNLNGSENTYVKENDPYIESSCHAIDTATGKNMTDIHIQGKVNTKISGDYKITYSVKGTSGQEYQKVRTVHVVRSEDFQGNKNGVPVLMYHWVYTSKKVPEKLDANWIKNTMLEQHLQYLTKNHYYFPSFQELKAYVEGKIFLPQKSVILTFDDGRKNFLKEGIPLLEKYKVPATSFVIGCKNGKQKVKQYASEYISYQSHSYNMHRGGGHIGHGGVISAMTQNEIFTDLKKNQEIVQNTEAFAYPYGDITPEGKKAVQEVQTLCAFSTHYGKVKKGMDLMELPRIRVFGNGNVEAFISSIQ